MVNVRLTDQFL